MKSIATALSLVFSFLWVQVPVQAAEQGVALVESEFWLVPRHGEVLLAHPQLKAAVQQLWVEPDSSLLLHYPDGESGELWGQELQAWLVSLGVASSRIGLRGGYEAGDGVAVILVTPDTAANQADEQTIQENSSVEGAAATTPAPAEVEMESQ